MGKAVHQHFCTDKLSHLRTGQRQYTAPVSLIPRHSVPLDSNEVHIIRGGSSVDHSDATVQLSLSP